MAKTKITLEELLTRDGRQRWLAAVAADDRSVTDGDSPGLNVHWSSEERFHAIDMLSQLNNDYRPSDDDEPIDDDVDLVFDDSTDVD